MAYPISRSMNADLAEGATDGSYKKVVRDRGQAEETTLRQRADLYDVWYGIHETPIKTLGDGRETLTPNYSPTPRVTDIL